MIQAIEQRRQTMLKVMNFIVDRQRDFFEKGVRVPQAAHAARGGRGHQHARVHGQPRDQREVRADAARRAAAQVLLLQRARRPPRARTSARAASGPRSRSWWPRRTARSRSPTRRSSTSSRSRASRSPAARWPSTATSSGSCRRACGSGYDPSRPRRWTSACSCRPRTRPRTSPSSSGSAPRRSGPPGSATRSSIVNDGSRDDTRAGAARARSGSTPFSGWSPTAASGASPTRSAPPATWRGGDVFVFYPADLQYLPEDIPALVAPILAGPGRHRHRHQAGQVREGLRLPASTTGSAAGSSASGSTDLNSVKAYRREVMHSVPLRPDWHRYMVVIAAADGFRLDVAAGAAVPAQGRASRSSTGAASRSACSTCSRSGSSSASAGSRCSSSASPGAVLFLDRPARRHHRAGAPLRLRHRLPAAAQPGRDHGDQRHRRCSASASSAR